jgi:hypothetical protein
VAEDFELRFRVSLGGKDEVTDFFDKSERSAKGFQSSLKSLGSSISSFANKAGSEFQAFAGKELGGSHGANARGVLKLRDAITQLEVSARDGTGSTAGLKEQIHQTAIEANQLQEDVTNALGAFVERTGDIQTARDNLAEYGRVATAAGASIRDIALVGESLSSKLNITKQTDAFALLAIQAKKGAVELRDFSTRGSQIFAAAASGNLTGEKGLREIGALTQIVVGARGGRTSAQMASSAAVTVESIFGQIQQKSQDIEDIGIKVRGRDQVEVLFDIIRKAKGDPILLQEVFKNKQARRGVEELAREFRNTGGFKRFEELRDVQIDPGMIARDFASRRGTGEAKIKADQIKRARFFDEYLGSIAEFGAEHSFELQAGIKGAGLLGGGLKMLSRFKGGGAVGGIGDGLSKLTAQRVFVVGGKLDGLSTPTPGTPTPPKLPTADVLKIAGGVAVPAAIAAGYVGAHSTMLNGLDLMKSARQRAAGVNDDLVTGRKKKVGHWYGGTSYEDVAPEMQAEQARKYAAEYRAATGKDPEVNLTVNIDEAGKVDVEKEAGTRAPNVMVRRGSRN